jgi:hypothetical protein
MSDEIPRETLRALFDLFLEQIKKVETELAVHKEVIARLKTEYSGLDHILDKTREDPMIAQKMEGKYAAIRQQFHAHLASVQSASEFLQKWTPEGPVN